MEELIKEIESCRLCEGRIKGTIPVAGEGNNKARVLLIGELPPESTHYSRSMFSGPSGRILKELINLSSLDRDDIYVTSLLKCTLSLEGDILRFSLSNCMPYIYRQIEIIKPLIICPLGSKVLKTLTGNRLDFYRYRGVPARLESQLYFPLLNPAEVFYNYNLRSIMERYFINLGKLYNSLIIDKKLEDQK